MSTMTLKPHLGCEMNLPAALGGENLHSLPPYAKTTAYPVDAYPACPENWERGGENDRAFFVEVTKGKGLWLDLNVCGGHSHHVAALLSIQGINPITGKPVGKPTLEQYQEGDIPQNYMATTGTPEGRFWLDGFRGADGEVRQYVFTEETLRGIAAQVIGNARSFSIGIAFFLSKKEKPKRQYSDFLIKAGFPQKIPDMEILPTKRMMWEAHWPEHTYGKPTISYGSGKNHLVQMRCMASAEMSALVSRNEPIPTAFEDDPDSPEEKLEIAAGARIAQQIHRDPERLDFWNPNPEGLLYIHYVGRKEGAQIRRAGRIGSKQEGALSGLRVGN